MTRDNKGQAYLRIKGNAGVAGEVSQTLYNLQGGKTYAASVWVQLKGRRTASLMVRAASEGPAGFVPLDREGWKIVRADSEETGDREGPAVLRRAAQRLARRLSRGRRRLAGRRRRGPGTPGIPPEDARRESRPVAQP